MSTIERMTITLTPEIAHTVRAAVRSGEYASSSEVVREALRDWRYKRAFQEQELQDLRTKIRQGLNDVSEGDVYDFDSERIIRKGEQQSSYSGLLLRS
uniref:Antitoxin ParD n=1 Tax=Candidatus Kentrum sp. FW TaxID=2126338 RepID=A0A450SIY6_9GAMM|nr:MAG: antitoxin ParD1/3/4 [Candidatus Kentron sp. FW]